MSEQLVQLQQLVSRGVLSLTGVRNLPNPDVLAMPDYETIVAENVAILEALKPDYAWLESDDYMLLVEAFSYRELHLRQDFNNRLQSSFLLLAKGNNLDARVADYGIARLEGEDDDALLLRTLESLDRFSTAGSAESYEYHAKNVSADISDAKAISPAEGKVTVYLASFDATITDELIAKVVDALKALKVRPITDEVTVARSTDKPIDLTIEVELLDLATQAEADAAIRQNFTRDFYIHEPLTLFDMVTNCDVAGVHNAVPVNPATGVVPSVGERLVINDLQLTFKQAVIEV